MAPDCEGQAVTEQRGCLAVLAIPSCFGFLAVIGLLLGACAIADLTH